MKVSKIENRTVRMNEIDCSVMVRSEDGTSFHYDMTDKEALQLAKDLLDACGVSYVMGTEPGPQADCGCRADAAVSSGMSLDEIQEQADHIHHISPNIAVIALAQLIDELAARMKELVVNEQGVVVSEIQKRIDVCDEIIAMYKCSNCGYEG